jgi:hypothetical protein
VEKDRQSSDDEEYYSANEDFGADECDEPPPGSSEPTNYQDFGVPRVGDVVIGGRWQSLEQLPPFGPAFDERGVAGAGWDQPDPKEVLPMSAEEVADCDRLIAAVGEKEWRSLPADLQLAFVRDVYGNPEGVGWNPEDAFENTVPVMQTCAKWAAEIAAFAMHTSPELPGEALFKQTARYAFTGSDLWGHPRIWATVTGWPPIAPEVKQCFDAEEVYLLHTKRFLEFQQLKREQSRRLQRPIALHCCVLAFEPSTSISINCIRWFFDALQYPNVAASDPKQPDCYTTDQWFFPMTLNAPAIVVNTPWKWRAAYGLAKKFMVEETASKFVFVGGDFLPVLRDHGVAFADIPSWILGLNTGEKITW